MLIVYLFAIIINQLETLSVSVFMVLDNISIFQGRSQEGQGLSVILQYNTH